MSTSKKVVLTVEIYDNKEKQKALKAVSTLPGIEFLAMDLKEKKLSVIGNVDAITVVKKLRKFPNTKILTVDSVKESDPPKKKEGDDKKDSAGGGGDKKATEVVDKNKLEEEERLKKEREQLAELFNRMSRNYYNPNNYDYPNNYYYHQQQLLQHRYHQQQQQAYYTQYHYNHNNHNGSDYYTTGEETKDPNSGCVIS
ncbi:heavy metal-associated isoprenylated plant protein 39-like [Andrographis paniculata]|uniref:heavy metal-associated isoprenylated plant protein 39-like n=1 Tax=Andrographis paniculata TaxID=175694 RepID=UPI0021E8D4A4|nr:heavy metal-associated isoprenylated plant protein 39-like [Andrographis paniculata]